MTREEFNESVMKAFLAWEKEELSKTALQIYNDSWEISKMQGLKDFLVDAPDSYVDGLYPYAENILGKLYDYEFEYDTPQWTMWNDARSMVVDFIRENESNK